MASKGPMMVVCLAVCLLTGWSEAAMTISHISPTRTSSEGGARLTIYGQDFPASDFQINDPNLGPKVKVIGPNGDELDGVIHRDGYTSTMITFYTPSGMETDVDYEIKVLINNVAIPAADHCPSDRSKCLIRATYYHTPRITSLSPQSVPTGRETSKLLTMTGRIITTRYGADTITSTNNIDQRILRVQAPDTCMLKNGDDFYGLDLDNPDSVWGTMKCMPNTTFVGRANLTFLVEAPFGRSAVDPGVLQVSSKGKIFTVVFYTNITSISSSAGSREGGQNITIHGPYFEDSGTFSTYTKAKVFVGGQECTNVYVERNSHLSCIVPKQQSAGATFFPGNRGIDVQYFDTPFASIDEAATSTAAPSGTKHFDTTLICGDEVNTKYVKMQGVFTAAETGRHQWVMRATNGGKLYVNGVVHVTSTGDWAWSGIVNFDAGQHIAFMVVAADGTDPAACIEVKVNSYDSKLNFRMTNKYGRITAEHQIIKLNSTVAPESMTLAFSGFNPSSTAASVNEVQKLCLADGSSTTARAGLYGALSEPFTFGEVAGMTSQLNKLPFLQAGETFDVTTDPADSSCVRIELDSTRGDIPLFESDSTGITATEVTKGVPGSQNVTFMMNGVPSTVLAYNSDTTLFTDKVKEAVSAMFGTRCPARFQQDGARYVEHYEADGNENSFPAFCGRYSKKDPAKIFSGSTLVNLDKYFCFAFRNLTRHILNIGYEATVNSVTSTGSINLDLTNILTTPDNEGAWNYTCVDVLAAIQTRAGSTSGTFKLTSAKVKNDNSDDTFYVDAVILTRVNATDGLTSATMPRLRLHPAYPNTGIQFTMRQIDVEYQADISKYRVDLYPHDCGNTFSPLTVSSSTGSAGTFPLAAGGQVIVARQTAATPPIQGTYNVIFNGKTSGTLSATMRDMDIKNTLQGDSSIGTVFVERTEESTCANMEIRVRFDDLPGNLPLMEITSQLTQPASAEAHILPYRDGHVSYSPLIGGEFLSTHHTQEQVRVYINDVLTECAAPTGCGYTYSDNLTPAVTSINPTSGNIGITVTITGSNFDATAADNVVKIGDLLCDVQSSTATQILCNLANGPIGQAAVSVNVASKGMATSTTTFTYTAGVTAVNPTTGSLQGGIPLTLSGSGFSSQATVQVGSTNCPVQSSTPTQIICALPPYTDQSAATNQDAVVSVTGGTGTATFTYNPSLTATISSITNDPLTVHGSQQISIAGSNFGSTQGTVTLGETELTIVSWSNTAIVATTPVPTSPGMGQLLSVTVPGVGWAYQGSSRPALDVPLVLNGIQPEAGSMYGGTTLTLQGAGFGIDRDAIEASVGDWDCEVTAVTNTKIECQLESTSQTHHVYNNGMTDFGIYYAFNTLQLDISVGDTVVFHWTTPQFVYEVAHGIYQVANATSEEQLPGGFGVTEKSANGQFSWTFNEPGEKFVWSGYVDKYNIKNYRMRIVVSAPEPSLGEVALSVAGQTASYNTNSGATPLAPVGSCTPLTSDFAGCTPVSLTPDDTSVFNFHFSECRSPIVTAITIPSATTNPRAATAATLLAITGSGFADTDCANTAMIGDCDCLPSAGSSSTTGFQCSIDDSCDYPIGELLPVTVGVNNYGNALVQISQVADRSVGYVPALESITPSSGSSSGGTRITLAGSDLKEVSLVTVNGIAAINCNYGAEILECTTPVSSSGEVAVSSSFGPGVCSGSCVYTYSATNTPTVTTVNPTSVSAATTLTIGGTLFPSSAASMTVDIGSAPCTNIVIVSPTEFTCDVSAIAAGNNKINVNVEGYGSASTTHTVTGVPSMNAPTPSTGSVHGNTTVTFIGHGFYGTTTITDGSANICLEVIVVDFTTLKCVTEPHAAAVVAVTVTSHGQTFSTVQYEFADSASPTVTSLNPTSGVAGDSLTLTGTSFSTNSAQVTVTVGDADCSVDSATDTSITCTLGSQPSGDHSVLVTIAGKGISNGDQVFTYQHKVTGISPASGDAGGNQVLSITGSGFTSASTITVCGQPCPVSIATTTSLTCITPNGADLIGQACSVVVTEDGRSVTAGDTYSFTASSAPVITGLNPANGGTGGGTSLTITGTGFTDPMSVSIAGVSCSVTSVILTEIVCTTGSQSGTISADVVVSDSSGIRAVYSGEAARFTYVDNWSSVYTWGAISLPAEGEMVVIGPGHVIILDTDTPILGMLLIDGGTLMFAEMDVTLRAKIIFINNGGIFQIGTQDRPFMHKAVIELYGDRNDPVLPIYGNKGIFLREGHINFFGEEKMPTWVELAQTAAAGDTTLHLTEAVDTWHVGDKIVVAPTGDHTSQGETEEHEIATISADKLSITLVDPLAYTHLGEEETYETPLGTKTFHFRAEVGILTRTIHVRGMDNPDFRQAVEACPDGFDTGEFTTQTCFLGRFGNDMLTDEFGAHILVNAAQKNQQKAQIHLWYVEMSYMGQAFLLGRYPVHSHMNGNMSLSYVIGCSIHHTFNRGINIHGTSYLLVENNVIYHTRGGTVFLEDGVEQFNVFRSNLILFIVASTSLLNEDITPAAFWITNPHNTYILNHAVASSHFGYWIRVKPHSEGPSADPTICPDKIPLLEFTNNTAHSNGWFGIWTFEDFYPMVGGGCNEWDDPAQAQIVNFRSWNNKKGIEYVNVGSIAVVGMISVNEKEACFEGKLNKRVVKGDITKSPVVRDTFCAARAVSSTISGSMTATQAGIVIPFGPGFMIHNVIFARFGNHPALKGTSIDGTCGDKCNGHTVTIDQVQFVDSPVRYKFRWMHEYALHALDDSLAGAAGYVLARTQFLPSTCTAVDYEDPTGIEAVLCPPTARFHRIAMNMFVPTSLWGKDLMVTSSSGTDRAYYRSKRIDYKDGIVFIVMDGEEYTLEWENAETLTNITYKALWSDYQVGDCNILVHRVEQRPDQVSIGGSGTEKTEKFDCSTPGLITNDWYYADNLVYVAVVGEQPARRKRSASGLMKFPEDHDVTAKYVKCFFTDCIVPPDPDTVPPIDSRPTPFWLWTDTTIWQDDPVSESIASNGTGAYGLPQQGDDVTILGHEDAANWIVIKNYNPPALRTLTLFGGLEIDPDVGFEYELTADYIIIIGGRLVVGWPDKPMFSSAVITLEGDSSSPVYTKVENVGAKSLAVFGGLDLHGQPVDNTWVRLTQLASAGATVLNIEAGTVSQWKAGDKIIVTSTSSNPAETEERTIASIDSTAGTITLSAALTYTHTAYSETINGEIVNFAGAVGLLSRNVVIQGRQSSSAFGGRVLVGMTDWDGQISTGFARVNYTEFRYMGQDGFTESYDARFALTYFQTGDVREAKPSAVNGNSFHELYSSAYGAFGVNYLNFSNNVVYKCLGHGLRLESDGLVVDNNLVSNLQWTGSYNGRSEAFNFRYEGSVHGLKATNLHLTNNFVAASQRGGYILPGEDCASTVSLYENNYAMSNLMGLVIMPLDELPGTCVKYTGFIIAKSRDYGMFFENTKSLVIQDFIFAANQADLLPVIIGPGALTQICGPETVTVSDSTFIGSFTNSDCSFETSPSGTFFDLISQCRGMRTPDGGRAGFVWPVFTGATNKAPEKNCANEMAYNTLCGKTTMSGNTFMNHGPHATCGSSYAISTDQEVDDLHHPVTISASTMLNNDPDYIITLHRPDVARVNPSDCVDMDCDAMKKDLLTDTDGTLFGGSPSSIFSDSAYEWDGDPRRGLGDYRIPLALLTAPDGNKLTRAQVAPNGTGIARLGSCQFHRYYAGTFKDNAYWKCDSQDYRMMVMESQDADTEGRRLSPVAVLVNGYIDLVNGPQDHGWCSGYTCQKRVSTFHMIGLNNYQMDIYLSSTQPEKMRYFMVDGQASDCFLVVAKYTNPNRIDVYTNDGNTYNLPTNGEMVDGRFVIKSGPDSSFLPSCTDPSGTNFIHRDDKKVYFVLKGGDMIVLKRAKVVIVSFSLPAMTEEEFFGSSIIENICSMLNIGLDQVRVVKIVSETGARRRRETGTSYVTAEIGSEATATASGTTEASVAAAATLMDSCQTGSISAAAGTTISSCDEIIVDGLVYYPVVPAEIRFEISPVPEHEGVPFAIQAKIRGYDSDGNAIEHLGIEQNPWQVTATLRSGTGHASAILTGTTTVSASSGWLNFTNLGISHAGSGYIIDFAITSPASTNLTTSITLDVDPLPLTAGVHSMTSDDIQQGSAFAITLDLRDKSTNQVIPDITWRGHTFAVTCGEVYSPGNLTGTLSASFDPTTGRVEFDDFVYNSYGFIYIACRIVSTPTEYDVYSYHKVVVLSSVQMATPSEVLENVVVRYSADFDTTLPDEGAQAQLHQATLSLFISQNPGIIIKSSTIGRGSIIITFTMEGQGANVTAALASICESISSGATVTVGSTSLTLDGYMTVDGADFYATCGKKVDSDSGLHPGYIALIVVVCVLVVAAIILLVVWLVCIKPKKRVHELEELRRRWDVQEYMDNGRTVFLAGATHKMPSMYAPMNTSLYDSKTGLRQSPLPPKNSGNNGLSPEPTMLSIHKENSTVSVGQPADHTRAITPTAN